MLAKNKIVASVQPWYECIWSTWQHDRQINVYLCQNVRLRRTLWHKDILYAKTTKSCIFQLLPTPTQTLLSFEKCQNHEQYIPWKKCIIIYGCVSISRWKHRDIDTQAIIIIHLCGNSYIHYLRLDNRKCSCMNIYIHIRIYKRIVSSNIIKYPQSFQDCRWIYYTHLES